MVRITRPLAPADWAAMEAAEVARVRALPEADRIGELGTKYRGAKQPMHRAQHRKCCYCEKAIEAAYNDVEHYRPKRLYWWLTWRWSNLLVACPNCNRSGKSDQFPLLDERTRLAPEDEPPGDEQPLLIDPGSDDPLDHIRFRPDPNVPGRWTPYARAGSKRGQMSIKTTGLDRDDLLDRYRFHREHMGADLKRLQERLASPDQSGLSDEWERVVRRWLRRARPFAALSYDVIDHAVPEPVRDQYGLELPRPPLGADW